MFLHRRFLRLTHWGCPRPGPAEPVAVPGGAGLPALPAADRDDRISILPRAETC